MRHVPLADDDHARPGPGGCQRVDPRQQFLLGEDDGRAAVVKEVRQLLIGSAGVEYHAYRRGPQDAETCLHQFHAIAEGEGDAFPAPYPEPCEMPGQPARAFFQLPVGDGSTGIAVGGLASQPGRVSPQRSGQRTHQLALELRHPHPFDCVGHGTQYVGRPHAQRGAPWAYRVLGQAGPRMRCPVRQGAVRHFALGRPRAPRRALPVSMTAVSWSAGSRARASRPRPRVREGRGIHRGFVVPRGGRGRCARCAAWPPARG